MDKMNTQKWRRLGLALALGATPFVTQAQQKIGGAAGAADPNAYLQLGDVTGANKGLLLSRVALTATSAASPLTAHVAGMTVYNTATAGSGNTAVTPGYYYNDGSKWVRIAANSDIAAMAWVPNGNTNGALKTIGTNDNFDLPFETNGSEKMRLDVKGNLGIGTSTPTAPLTFTGNGRKISLYAAAANDNQYNGFGLGAGQLISQVNDATNNFSWRAGTSDTTSNYLMTLTGGGKLGLGTTAPGNMLTVNGGKIQYTDGTQGNGKVLVSDANGVASWQPEGNNIAGQNVTAGSNKVTLGGTPTGAALKPFSVDVNEANININNLLGPLNLNKIASGGATTNQSLVWNGSAWVPGTGAATAWVQNGNNNGSLKTIGTNDNFDLPFVTNNSEKMRLNTGGYLGMGTTTPTSIVNIVNDNKGNSYDDIAIQSYNSTGGSNDATIYLKNARGTAVVPANLQSGDALGDIYMNGRVNNGEQALTRINSRYMGDGTTNLSDLAFATSNNWRMYIDPVGNVGINTTAPATKLDIENGNTNGAIKIVDGTQGANKVLTSDGNGVGTWQTVGNLIAGQNVTAGSNKVTLGGTPTGAALKPFSVDVNEANININNLLGPLNLNKIASGGATTDQSLVWNGSAWVPGMIAAWLPNGNNNGSLKTIGTNDNFDLPFETNGSEKMRLNTGGYLGMGTTAPGSILDITNDNRGNNYDDVHIRSYNNNGGNAPGLYFNTTRGTVGAPANLQKGDYLGTLSLNGRANNGDQTFSGIDARYMGNGTTNLSDLAFGTSGSQRMYIDTIGNVGIGTSTPTAPLTFTGTGRKISLYSAAANDNQYNGFGAAAGQFINQINTTTDRFAWQAGTSATTSNSLMTLTGGGNLGLGTTNPGNMLTVNGGKIQYTDGTQGNGKVLVSDANGVASWQPEGNNIAGQNVTAGSNKVTLGGTPTGAALKPFSVDVNEANININNLLGPLNLNKIASGGATTNQSLVWNGSAWVPGTGAATAWVQNGNNNGSLKTIGTNDNFDLPFVTNNSEKMRLNTGGYLGMGTTAPGSILDITNDNRGSNYDDVHIRSYNNNGGNAPGLYFNTTRGTVGAPANLQKGDYLGSLSLNGRANNGDQTFSGIDARYMGNGTTNLSDLAFGTSGSQRMYIDTIGNVGIGTSTPTAPLTFTGTGRKISLYSAAANDNQYNGFGLVPGYLISQVNSTTDNFAWQAGTSATNSNTVMMLTGAGNLGIGTSGPATKLDIENGNTNGAIKIVDGTQGANKVLTSDANGVGTWKQTAVDLYNAPLGAGVAIPSTTGMNYLYTNTNITLPPGKWLVSVTMLIAKNGGGGITNTEANESWWVRTTFSTNTSATPTNLDIMGNSLISGTLSPMSNFGIITGGIVINNTSGANKTYYYMAGGIGGNGVAGSVNPTGNLMPLGGNGWSEDYITYQRIN